MLRSLGLLAAAALAATPAQAEERDDRVATHIEAAQKAYHQGNYAEAAAEFSAGYLIVPHPEFLINIGKAYRKAGRTLEARWAFERFLVEAPPDHPERAKTESLLVQLGGATPGPATAAPASVAVAGVVDAPPACPPPERPRTWLLGIVIGGAALLAGAAGLAIGLAARGTQVPQSDFGISTVTF